MDNQNGSPTKPVTYWDYIKLDDLLSLQKPITDAHDELQFVMIHQIFELWFKLAIFELRGSLARFADNDIKGGTALLKRVASILRTSLNGFDPLMTMSQQGYAEFRDALAPASGFQSSQFRVLEILLGIERISSDGDHEKERFYWENAVQTGITFDHFVEKYYDTLETDYEKMKEQTLRRSMLRLTEEATGQKGIDAYRTLFQQRDDYPELYALAETGRDLQQSLLDFRLSHHKVTVFTIGKHEAGTSDSHQAKGHSSCAEYLMNVAKDQSVIFPELESAITEL